MENEKENLNKEGEPFFGFGYPDEWWHFAETYRVFLERKHFLFELMSKVFTRVVKAGAPEVDRIVFDLGLNCAQDYREILLLCANGFGIGAQKLLRSLYEKAVTADYLSSHPEEASKFHNYFYVHMNKLLNEEPKLREGLKLESEYTGDEFSSEADYLEQNYNRVRDDYLMTDCKICGTKKPTVSWSKLSLKAMAQKGKSGLDAYYTRCYVEPLLHSHPSMPGMLSRRRPVIENEEEGDTYFHEGPQRFEVSQVMVYSHILILSILNRQIEHFGLELQDELWECGHDIEDMWIKKDKKEDTEK